MVLRENLIHTCKERVYHEKHAELHPRVMLVKTSKIEKYLKS